jgi:uncharacterized protein
MTDSKFDLCLILHGCPPSEESVLPKEKRWMNWLEGELVHKGLNAIAPDMPASWNPKYLEWKNEIEKYPITFDSYLVGHSCGAAFLVRWLLENKKKVKKLILVAPAKMPENDSDTRKDLYDFELPLDGTSIADEIVVFISNDHPHHLRSFELYSNSLKPRVIRLENKGHFLIFTMGTNEFPELLEEVLS